MPVIGTLWNTSTQQRGKVILAVAALAGLSFDQPDAYEHHVDNKKPGYTSKFPHGKIPAFESKTGFRLFEGMAIARYVAGLAPNCGLLGHTLEDAALVDQWVHLVETEVGSATDVIKWLVIGVITPYSKSVHTSFVERQLRALKTLDTHLLTHTFFVGERITLADIAVANYVQQAAMISFDAPLRTQLPNIMRHYDTVINQPQLKDIFRGVKLIDKGLEYAPPRKEKEKEKPKPPPVPPKPTKKAVKAPENEEEEEPIVPLQPKVHNPLDDLPKSSFNLEDWKRAYYNLDTRGSGGAIEWFYERFDKEGFSVWRIDFKYNEELTQTYMSSNQIAGLFNRLEASRKYGFGSVGVLGVANDSRIAGVFIARGQDIMPVVQVAPDWESYEFTRLDLENAEQKAFFEAALAWDLEIDGKKWVDGKAFK